MNATMLVTYGNLPLLDQLRTWLGRQAHTFTNRVQKVLKLIFVISDKSSKLGHIDQHQTTAHDTFLPLWG